MERLGIWLAAVLAVFAPVKTAIIAAIVLVIVDLITGIIAAKKRGEPITSSDLKRTVAKLALYEAAICISFIAQQYLVGDMLPVAKIAAAVVGLTELKSILENFDSISGTDTWQSLIDKVTAKKNDPV